VPVVPRAPGTRNFTTGSSNATGEGESAAAHAASRTPPRRA
jgi:hypothetical protein